MVRHQFSALQILQLGNYVFAKHKNPFILVSFQFYYSSLCYLIFVSYNFTYQTSQISIEIQKKNVRCIFQHKIIFFYILFNSSLARLKSMSQKENRIFLYNKIANQTKKFLKRNIIKRKFLSCQFKRKQFFFCFCLKKTLAIYVE